MKQKLLFLALMAISSQSLLSYHRHYYGGPGFGFYAGPGYGYYGPGYYPDYYYGYRRGPFDVVGDVVGAAITADAIKSAANESRQSRNEDVNKSRRAELKGRIFDAEDELNSLKKNKASTSEISAKKEEIESLNKRLRALR